MRNSSLDSLTSSFGRSASMTTQLDVASNKRDPITFSLISPGSSRASLLETEKWRSDQPHRIRADENHGNMRATIKGRHFLYYSENWEKGADRVVDTLLAVECNKAAQTTELIYGLGETCRWHSPSSRTLVTLFLTLQLAVTAQGRRFGIAPRSRQQIADIQ